MKKIIFSIIAIMLIAIIGCSAASNFKFDVINGQKVMYGDVNAIVNYLKGLDRQELIDLAEIDRGKGVFYARVLPGQEIMTWSDGTRINAYDLSNCWCRMKMVRYFLTTLLIRLVG